MQITYLMKPYQFIPREFYIELVELGPGECKIPWKTTTGQKAETRGCWVTVPIDKPTTQLLHLRFRDHLGKMG